MEVVCVYEVILGPRYLSCPQHHICLPHPRVERRWRASSSFLFMDVTLKLLNSVHKIVRLVGTRCLATIECRWGGPLLHEG